MSQSEAHSGSERLILTIRSAYSIALIIIAAMALLGYLLIQNMLAEQRADDALINLVESQKTLSQRVVFLANAARSAAPEHQSHLLEALSGANRRFSNNYQALLRHAGLAADSGETSRAATMRPLFVEAPHFLSDLSQLLVSNGRDFVRAMEGLPGAPRAARPVPGLDGKVADAVLEGYTALGDQMVAHSQASRERLLFLHRWLFIATIVVIGLVVIFVFRPMTQVIRRRTAELVEARNSMAYQAVHDGLTGLYNRVFMKDRFDALLSEAVRRGERVAVIQIDLDRFKQINDTLGHAAGDFVLVSMADRIRRSCRASDICARLGGDEFVMIMPTAGSPQDIDGLAARIVARLNEPLDHNGTTLAPGASAGIAVFPLDADNGDDMLVHADLALYAAKRQGGGSYAFFSSTLRQELEHRKQLEADLKVALAENSFLVHYQPQVSLTDGRVTGMEALARWHHPARGVVAPCEFIPVAERCGLMPEIGRLVMAKAIREAAAWHRRGIRFGRLALNVSSAELRDNGFTGFLFATLEEAGLPFDRLALEIVESVILDDEKTGIASKLRLIRAAGIHLELDDFGTGYASLSHVNPDEIDRLKIDRRFIQNIDAHAGNTKIVKAIMDLARGLGIDIVAEGAETEEELSLLMEIGCDQVQGYSIAFPMPDVQAAEWLAARGPHKPHLTLLEGSRA